jgi:hypothetical protein
MNAALAVDSGGMDARALVERLDSRIRTLTATREGRPGPFQVLANHSSGDRC